MFKINYLCLTFLLIIICQALSAQSIRLEPDAYTINLPEGKTTFSLDENQIVIKFNKNVSQKSIETFFRTSSFFQYYDTTWKLPFPAVFVARFIKDNNSTSFVNKSAQLQLNSLIQFTSPVLIYKEKIQQAVYDLFYVKLKKKQDAALLRSYAASLHFTIEKESETNVFFCRSNKKSKGNAFEIAKYLQTLSIFEFAEPDFIYWGKSETNDNLFTQQWALNNTAQFSGGVAGDDIDVVNAWTLTTGIPTIKVAILDCFGSSAQFTHPDFSFQTIYDATGTGFSASGYQTEAHGINCGGLIGATTNNTIGIAGIAYNAKVLAVKIGTIINSSGNWSSTGNSISDGITWAYQNAHVISNSNSFGSSSSLINTAIANAITIGRWGKGAPFFSSSGNNSSTSIGYPASNSNTIAVGASNVNDSRATFSDYGTGLDIAAPGVNVYSTDIAGTAGFSTTDYFLFTGTSAACPVAAGIMALILSADSTLSFTQARNIIETSCQKVGSYVYNTSVTGQPNGTWCTNLGYGRVNAYQAVLLALTAPLNNAPDSAFLLTVGASCNFTNGLTAGATESMNPDFCSGSSAVTAKDVWYKFTPTQSNVTIKCQAGYNTDIVLGLFAGNAMYPGIVQCTDITGAGGLETIFASNLISNTTYFIRVYDYNGNANGTDFKICLQYTPAVTNNTINGSQLLCPGILPGSISGSTASGGAGFALTGYKDGSDFYNLNIPTSWTIPLNQDTLIRGSLALNSFGRTGPGMGAIFANNYNIVAGRRAQVQTGTFSGTIVYDSLRFDLAHAAYPSYTDSLVIYSSTGGAFSRLAGWGSSQTVNIASGITTSLPLNTLFFPSSSQWVTKVLALPVGTVQIRFEFYSSFGNQLYLDRVLVDEHTPTYTYQWLKSITSGTTGFSPATLVNNTFSYNPPPLQATTWFRRLVTSGGVRDTSIAVAITIKPKPNPLYNINNSTQCLASNNFIFTDNSSFTGGTFTRLWNFGNSITDTSSIVNPSKTYISPGNYLVKLLLNGSNGCNDSLIKTVLTGNRPTVGFTINNYGVTQCTNFKFTFSDTSKVSSGALTRLWNFGDGFGDTSNSISTDKVFNIAGSYPIKLVVSSYGCKDSVTKTISVSASPVAGFTVNKTQQCLKANNFIFTDTSSGIALNRTWNFGGGLVDTSSLLNPNKMYSSAGNYTIQLKAISGNGCVDSIIKTVSVLPSPQAGFNINNTMQCFNINRFNVVDSSMISAGNISRRWNFGTGISDTSNLANTYKIYTSPGNYSIRLISLGANGCNDTMIKTITVFASPQAGFTLNNPRQCMNTNNFQFTDTSIISAGTLQPTWSFGDGGFSSQTNPAKSYSGAGNYIVKLRTTSNNGCVDSVVRNITVYQKPNTGFTINKIAQCLNGNNFLFTDTTPGSVTRQWNLNDSGFTTNLTASKTYNQASTYNVKLYVSNANNCMDTLIKSITVNPQPGASINLSGPASFCRGSSVVLNANTGSGYSYKWIDHNGILSVVTDSSLSTNSSGGYKVIVTNSFQCTDTSAWQSLSVLLPPDVTISYNGNPAFCNGDSLLLNASGTGGVTWQWFKNDSLLPSGTQSIISVKTSGNYKVKASNTCDSIAVPVQVTENPNPVKPAITRLGDTLQSSAVSGNQWYLGTTKLNGATAIVYYATVHGNYSVQTSNSFGCANTSDTFAFIPTALSTPLIQSALQLYPNPNNGTFNIHSEAEIEGMEINDMSGRIIYQTLVKFKDNTITLDPTQASAMYFVRTVINGSSIIHKIVVVK